MNKVTMKKFTKQEIIELYGQVTMGEISFSQMVEIMNDRMEEANDPQYKDGDFLVGIGCIFILHKQIDKYSTKYHVLYAKTNGSLHYCSTYSQLCGTDKLRLATEVEKQELLDALAKEGKRWNAEKLCVEDIPKRKFQKGDKVRIKAGVSSKTHMNISPGFIVQMDDLIGKELTVDRYANGMVYVEESYYLHEGWLEPYVEELKKGDLAIFWNEDKRLAAIRFYEQSNGSEEYIWHKDSRGFIWDNVIKFESKEQYEKLLKGEI